MNLSRFVAPFRLLHGDENQANWEGLEEYLGLSVIERGTSLPTNPVDGQEYDYVADATNGVIWRLRYRAASASTHKWEFVGGARRNAENNETSLFTLASNAFVYQEVPKSPVVTLPLAGDYDCLFRLEYLQQRSAGETLQLNIGVGSAVSAIYLLGNFVGEKQFSIIPVMETQRIANMSAGVVLKLFAAGNNLLEWQIGTKDIAVIPVRVG